MITRRLTGLLLALLPGSVAAQQLFNSTHSNYSGLTGVNWNPATIADNRYFLQLQLVGFDVHATNTAYRYTGAWSPQNSGAKLDLNKEFLTRRDSDKPKVLSAGLNLRGPGLMVRISPTQSIAFGTRVRAAMQGNAVSENLLQNAIDKFKTKNRSADNTFNLNLNAYSEYDLTYGRVIMDKSLHFLKAGITAKRYIGFGSGYLRSQQADYQIVDKTAATGDTIVRINNLEAAFGYSNPDAFDDVDVDQALKWLSGGGGLGNGWGADLGVVYEYRPNMGQYRYIDKKGVDRLDYSRNKYLYRVAVSVTDVGYIRYKNATAYNNIKTSNSGVSESDLDGIDLDNYEARLNKILKTQKQQRENEFVAGVPTALNVDVDYHVHKWLYANAAVSQSLRGKYAIGMRNFSYASVTPRIESKWLEVATPISLLNGYQTLAYGLMLRLGPLVIGSNDLAAYFDSSSPYGFNGYAEISLLTLANGGHKSKHRPSRLKDGSK